MIHSKRCAKEVLPTFKLYIISIFQLIIIEFAIVDLSLQQPQRYYRECKVYVRLHHDMSLYTVIVTLMIVKTIWGRRNGQGSYRR